MNKKIKTTYNNYKKYIQIKKSIPNFITQNYDLLIGLGISIIKMFHYLLY